MRLGSFLKKAGHSAASFAEASRLSTVVKLRAASFYGAPRKEIAKPLPKLWTSAILSRAGLETGNERARDQNMIAGTADQGLMQFAREIEDNSPKRRALIRITFLWAALAPIA